MFARIYREDQNKEVLINLNYISLIDVTYAVLSADGRHYADIALRDGVNDPKAVRLFKFKVDGERFVISAKNPDDPLAKALGQIYNDAIKGLPKVQSGDDAGS